MLPYLVAGAVAALVAIIEQANRLNARFTLRNHAWLWWGLRTSLEIFIGVAALAALRQTDVGAADELWGWIVAGASGPAVARLRVLDFGRGDEARPIGVATVYEPARGFFEEQIDKRGAEAQATWIATELLPWLERNHTDPAALASYVIDYLRGLQVVS